MIGSVIPGSTIIFALSALIPGGELRLEWVLAVAVAGALLGDGSAFWFGHRAKREILSSWPLSKYPRVIARSEAFFNRWGALAVFFARFVPPIRAFVPITAGALGMPPLRFYATNIPAILLWAPLTCCRACWRFRRCTNMAGSPIMPGRQALLDTGRDRRRADRGAGDLGDPPPARRGAIEPAEERVRKNSLTARRRT